MAAKLSLAVKVPKMQKGLEVVTISVASESCHDCHLAHRGYATSLIKRWIQICFLTMLEIKPRA